MSGATPEHGRLSRYKKHGCRCADCRAANARAARDRRRQMAYGNPPRVDAGPVREHIAKLRAQGFGLRRISALSGVPRSTVDNLAGVKRGRDQHTVAPAIAEALLALGGTERRAGLADKVSVPALGSRRRLQALMRAGWSITDVAYVAGLNRVALGRVLNPDRTTVAAMTHDGLALAFETLDPQGPRTTSPRRQALVRARKTRAARAGWAPPLAWDDPDTDAAPKGVVRDEAS